MNRCLRKVDLIEDRLDIYEAKKAIADIKKNGTIP
jgi:hypothetical protein